MKKFQLEKQLYKRSVVGKVTLKFDQDFWYNKLVNLLLRGPRPLTGKESFLHLFIPSVGGPEELWCLFADFLEASKMKKTEQVK